MSYFSRFTMKFVELVAAGVATAVSGYVVAHLSGYLTSTPSVPAAIELAPRPSSAAKTVHVQPATAPAEANAERAAAKDADVATPHPERAATGGEDPASRKRTAVGNTGNEAKSKDVKSVEAEVRAALAKAEANRAASADVRPAAPDRRPASADNSPASPVIAPVAVPDVPSRHEEAAVESTGALPPSRDATATPVSPLQQAPVQLDPPATVEIKSAPVATEDDDSAPVPPSYPNPPVEGRGRGPVRDLFAAIKHIPDLLRPDAEPPNSDNVLRPPMPVGH